MKPGMSQYYFMGLELQKGQGECYEEYQSKEGIYSYLRCTGNIAIHYIYDYPDIQSI